MGRTTRAESIRLTARDTIPIYAERTETPRSVVGCTIVDGTGSTVTREAVHAWATERIDALPVLRRRLRRTPLDLRDPRWVESGPIDLDEHLSVHEVADWKSAERLLAREVETRVDLTRPPWRFTVLHGIRNLGPGWPEIATLLVPTMHHSLVDGVSGRDLYRQLFTEHPEPETPESAHSEPGPLREVAEGLAHTWRFVRNLRTASDSPSDLALTSTDTHLTRAITGRFTIDWIEMDLPTVRAIRKRVPVSTTNDICLTVVSLALQDLLNDIAGPISGPLVSAMPVQVESLTSANSYVPGLVDLHIDQPEPLARIQQINASTQAVKDRIKRDEDLSTRKVADQVPAYVVRFATRDTRAEKRRNGAAPPGSPATMVSNVPTRLEGASFLDAPVVGHIGLPCLDRGRRLTHYVSSHGDRLFLSFTADADAIGSARDYRDRLAAAYQTLVRAGSSVPH